MLNKILLATDLSNHSKDVLPYAAAVARKTGAKLVGSHVFDVPSSLTTGKGADLSNEGYAERLRSFFAHPDLAPGEVELLVPVEVPEEGMGVVVEAEDVDASMVAQPRRGWLEAFFRGSEVERFLRLATRPVWMVPQRGTRSVSWSPIVCAVDFHRISRRALHFAVQLASEQNTSIVAVHVLEAEAADGERRDASRDLEVRRRKRQEQLEELLSTSAAPPGSKAVTTTGDPSQALIDTAAAEESDLLIMGVKGDRSGNSAVLGSVADRIIRSAPLPVLLHP